MEAASTKKLSGLFSTKESASGAYDYLHELGYKPASINIFMSEEVRKNFDKDIEHYSEKGTHAAQNAGIGSLVGGTVGAVATILATIGISVFVPGLGIFIGGPLVAGIIGGSAGVITGGICGALIGADVPAEQAKQYETGIEQGKILIMVEPRNEEEARAIESHWVQNGGEQIHW